MRLVGAKEILSHQDAVAGHRPCPAAAANFGIFTRAAAAFQDGLTQDLKLRRVTPDRGESAFPDRTHLLFHIGAGRDAAIRGDAAIPRTGKAAAGFIAMRRGNGPIRVEFPSHALEMGRAFGPDHDLRFIPRRLRHPAHDPVIGFGRNVRHLLAAPRADQKEYVQHEGADVTRVTDHVLQLVGVVVGDGEMNLEAQIVAATGVYRRLGPDPGTRQAAEIVMKRRIQGIEADAGALQPRFLQSHHPPIVKRQAVGPENGHQAETGRMGDQFREVGPQQRFAAGEDDHGLVTEPGDIVQQFLDFRRRQFVAVIALARPGIQIAVRAVQIATARQVEGDEERRCEGVLHGIVLQDPSAVTCRTGREHFRNERLPCLPRTRKPCRWPRR